MISEKYGLRKLGPDTHLYISDSFIPNLDDLGKWFEILEVAPFGKAALRDFASRWPGTGVTARALPLSSDQLRLKLESFWNNNAQSGEPGIHLFGLGSSIGRLLIAVSTYKIN